MKEYLAVLTALLFLLPVDAAAADDLSGAAREVARKTAGFVGKGETASIAWRNVSSLPPAVISQIQTTLGSSLRDFGVRVADTGGAVEMRVTVSENQSQYVIAAEVRKGEERQAFLAAWKRNAGGPGISSAGAVTLERKLLWEQTDPILDVALTPSGMLILSPSKLTLYARKEGSFEPVQSAPIAPPRPWPRDPRARLRLSATAYRAFVPGGVCSGSVEPVLSAECRPSEEPWTLDSGNRTMLLAGFATGRNYFDGHIVMQNGARKIVPPFFTAGEAGGYWLMTLLDGRTRIFDSNFDPAGFIPGWGSDLAATGAHCGTGTQILATKPGDSAEADSVRAYSIVNQAPAPLAAPVEFSGPVTALWTMDGASAVAVVRDLATGRYAAYWLKVECGG